MNMNKMLTTAVAALTVACLAPHALAGTEMNDTKDMKGMTPPTCGEKDWTIELGSGAEFSNVRDDSYANYTIEPIEITAGLKVDDVSLDNFLGGIFRGYTEFLFRGQYDVISHGPEDRYAGILVGPRYNFVQPGWKIIPYVEGTVGIGFANSNPTQGGLGQDFNFSFETGAGAKYQINCDWSVRLGVQYQHMSNAGLSSPIKNNPIDAIGPILSVGYSF
jgi:opacity protein-like surface antigen